MDKPKTVQEFLAQGGKITKCPVVQIAEDMQSVRSTTVAPAVIMTLDEADLMYGEKSNRKKKEKNVDLTGVNLNDLPEELRKSLGI